MKKTAQSRANKKTSQKTKLALIVLALVLLVLVIGKVVSIINNFKQPISRDSEISRLHPWDKTANLNLVIKSKNIALLSYDPINKEVLILEIPDSLYVNVPSGFGNWKISSVFDLGQAEENKIGAKLLKASVANFLGVPVDGYIVFEGKYKEQSTTQLVNVLRDGIFASYKLLPNIKSDLTTQEFIRLSGGLSKVRFDKLQDLDLTQLNLLDKSLLGDGTPIFTSDPDRVDSISSKLVEAVISNEKSSIAVYNATNTPGLALKAGRVISNIGGNVIISTNAGTKRKQTIIFTNDLTSQTAKRLGQIFTSDCSDSLKCGIIVCKASEQVQPQDKCFVEDQQILNSRASISVVIGEDYVLRP